MPGGRPSKYHKLVTDLQLVTDLFRSGFTLEDLATFYQVANSTISKWKDEIPEFSEAIKEGTEISNARVAAALYKRAIGFTQKINKTFQTKEGPVTEEVELYYPPDTAAAFIYSKNRNRTRWKDKWEEEIKNSEGYEIEVRIKKRSDGESKSSP